MKEDNYTEQFEELAKLGSMPLPEEGVYEIQPMGENTKCLYIVRIENGEILIGNLTKTIKVSKKVFYNVKPQFKSKDTNGFEHLL